MTFEDEGRRGEGDGDGESQPPVGVPPEGPPPDGVKTFPFAPKAPWTPAKPRVERGAGEKTGGGFPFMPPPPSQGPPASEIPPPPPPSGSWHPADQAFAGDYRGPSLMLPDEIVIPDAPPPPPERIPQAAFYATFGAALLASIAYVVIASICCFPEALALWIFGASIGAAASRFGGSGRRMGVVCGLTAFVSMFLSVIIGAVVSTLVFLASMGMLTVEEEPKGPQTDAEFAVETLNETFENLDAVYDGAPEYDLSGYDFDEGAEYYDEGAEEYYEEEEMVAETETYTFEGKEYSGRPSFNDIFWDLFFIFDCWGIIGMILGVASAYKIGSGFNQIGYQKDLF